MVEERYTRANGYEADCDVIYGDTDSVMVHFRVRDIARAMELGREAAEYVSKTFVKPIKLEFEKARRPPEPSASAAHMPHAMRRCDMALCRQTG